MQWHTQAGSTTNKLNVKIHFTPTEIIMAKTKTLNFNVDDSSKFRYDIILGRDLFDIN